MAQQISEGIWEEIAAHAKNCAQLLTFDRDLPKQAARNAPGVLMPLL